MNCKNEQQEVTATNKVCSASDANQDKMIPEGYQLIKEGSAKMLYPTGVVFYNPVQVQNRDLSILIISLYAERRAKRLHLNHKKKEFLKIARNEALQNKEIHLQKEGQGSKQENGDDGGDTGMEDKINANGKIPQNIDIDMKEIETKLADYESNIDWKDFLNNYDATSSSSADNRGIRILDALAASGLRSIRYWNEIPSSLLHSVTINDLDPAAVDLGKQNVEYNNLGDFLIQDDIHSAHATNDTVSDKCNTPPPRGIKVQIGDATHVMYMARRPPGLLQLTHTQKLMNDQYDVIDLDPYGSAAPFLDAAVQSVTNGGLLAITCTDMAALGGSHPETCYGRYASMPIPRAKYLQELALRILLHSIATKAACYGRIIKPILSVGMNFYVRVFVEVWDSKGEVNDLSLNIGTVYQSTQCPSFHIIPHGQHARHNKNVIQTTRAPLYPVCPETGGQFKTAGPCWIGPLHDFSFVKEAISRLEPLLNEEAIDQTMEFSNLATCKRIHGLLTVVSEELHDVPLYYLLPDLCHILGCPMPPMNQFRAALSNAGYRSSAYHKEAQAIKTDAPNSVIWDILRHWCESNPPKKNSKNSKNRRNKKRKLDKTKQDHYEEDDNASDVPEVMDVSEKILSIKPSINVDFTIPTDFKKVKKAARFPMNPEKNWGPKPRASGYKKGNDMEADDSED